MTEAMKEGLKYRFWQFFGSMFMETKNGGQALSLHRVLSMILFLACMILWFWSAHDVPDSMLCTLWGLLGINGAHKVAKNFGSGSKATDTVSMARSRSESGVSQR